MKKFIPAIAGTVLLFASCKEKAPYINFGQAVSVDTTYVLAAGSIPATDQHNVLVEEYTGATCTNCPAAHETLKEIQKSHSGRVNVIGLYIYGPLQARPPIGAKYDFRDSTATDIANEIYLGVNALPSGGVDRVPVGGLIKLDKSTWTSAIENRLLVDDSLNLKVESGYNATDKIDSIKVTITYTKSVGYPHNLSIVIVEDSLIDIQEYPSTDPVHPGADEEYVFTNVFRGMASSGSSGDPVLPAIPVKEPGRVQIKNYLYKLPGKVVDPKHCRVIAYINSTNTGEKRILQSTQVKMVK
jgi:hypothetical protein